MKCYKDNAEVYNVCLLVEVQSILRTEFVLLQGYLLIWDHCKSIQWVYSSAKCNMCITCKV